MEKKTNQGLHKFPNGITIQIFETLTTQQQESILKRLYSFMGYKGLTTIHTIITKYDFKKIDEFKFSNTLYRLMVSKTKEILKTTTDVYNSSEPAPQWGKYLL